MYVYSNRYEEWKSKGVSIVPVISRPNLPESAEWSGLTGMDIVRKRTNVSKCIIYTHTYIYNTYTYTHIYTYIHTYPLIHIHSLKYTYIHIFILHCVHTYIHIYIHT